MEHRRLEDRYINPYTDFGFKVLFGTEMNKELLISFVNSLLVGKETIRDLTCEAYEDSLKVYRDWLNTIVTAESKGHAKGLEEGLEKGYARGLKEVEKKQRETAVNLKEMGISAEMISKATGFLWKK